MAVSALDTEIDIVLPNTPEIKHLRNGRNNREAWLCGGPSSFILIGVDAFARVDVVDPRWPRYVSKRQCKRSDHFLNSGPTFDLSAS
ncbi:hypothetical protein TWF225_008154 [Orbilia oligospora]|uniref:Uncharacterized protein n=1 Tax=Orbilia oligospora TaxID=2813651 RepID=A0A7C8P5U5_ORBOL|nr:hypothetical protein TWF751_002948 [Orbilia oligospora]KAF3193966.1 hypothetical protein TWF225_008154 [Orbilia oligospora]KAF3261380.1 hypothetical protein TWF128_003145 [Orbilia oligospora]KAF3293257.1 hypothetical protein TWF132_004902 [Orbilia oligospora]TGJ67787.1 hypothetical protein EYR41_006893 [Orbilia oligospora]